MEWQPIETAPRRYRPPIFFPYKDGFGPTVIGRAGEYEFECFWLDSVRAWAMHSDNRPCNPQPVLWKPMPEPPHGPQANQA